MNLNLHHYLCYVVLALWLLVFSHLTSSCKTESKKESDQKTSTVVAVSIAPQAWFIDQIADGLVETEILVPTGENPEIYDPAPRQIGRLEKADLYLYTGTLAFEEKWVKLVEATQGTTAVNISKHIPDEILYGSHEHSADGIHHHPKGDPHFWSSYGGASALAEATYIELLKILPEDSLILSDNYRQLRQTISQMRAESENLLAQLAGGRAFIIFHPSLSAFSEEMSLTQIVIEEDGKEPSTRHLAEITDIAKKMSVKVTLLQRSFNPSATKTIAKSIGTNVVEIDPYSYDWLEEMRRITQAIADGGA